ncbi:hypothetical protein [Lacticaseibacillus paracasei]|uniref:Bacterial Pleckstrin homology domain-containing protein n=1 Tax=Lacticaseibacillus paracasei TaxID=1597 RepID=A0A422M975_LACPA|nr:hypothetical protein [Lacticaseibacillus paracasei]RND51565.1 hypothetical protein FAM18119_02927 [Lacticaseibacillus paracasei]RND84756.1 hypothetical protein FAM18157_00101 [Lacticaseibacillus paracasei]
MQNKIEIKDDQLIVLPQGINKLASLTKKIAIPLQHVHDVSIDLNILNDSKGIRSPGTIINGYYWSGTYIKGGEKTFFNIKKGNKPVVIQLINEKYTRLVLGVDNPEKIVELIKQKIN